MARKLSSQESKAVKQARKGALDEGPSKKRKQQALAKTKGNITITQELVDGQGTTDDDVAQAERLYAILEYRKMGASLVQIAKKFDITAGRVHQIISRALAQLVVPDLEDVRKLELERLDTMQMALWGAATKGDIGAITTILSIMNRRARYLGLDVTEAIPSDPEEKATNEAEARNALLAKLLLVKKRIDDAEAAKAKEATP